MKEQHIHSTNMKDEKDDSARKALGKVLSLQLKDSQKGKFTFIK